MLEKYNDAEAIVTVEGKTYALYKKGPLKRYPYIVDTSTGGIPDGQQLPIVKSYLGSTPQPRENSDYKQEAKQGKSRP